MRVNERFLRIRMGVAGALASTHIYQLYIASVVYSMQIHSQYKLCCTILSFHMCFSQVNELDPVCCNLNCILVVSYLNITLVSHIY